MQERLQKIIAAAGIASRRKSEELITAGRVRVNDVIVTTLGAKADPETDRIEVDGRPIKHQQRGVYFILNKPRRVLTTVRDDRGRRTVMEFFPDISERVYPVGRLDYDSEGLLLLTNDGELAFRLMHPRYHVPKTYLVFVRGHLGQDSLVRLRSGVDIGDGRTQPAQVELLDWDRTKNISKVKMTIREGRNRQIRRMLRTVGHHTIRLIRIVFGPLTLGDLCPGERRKLTEEEVAKLYQAVNLE